RRAEGAGAVAAGRLAVALARLAGHCLLRIQRIVAVDDVDQQAHFADAEPFQFGMLIADIGGFAAPPLRNGINVVQRIAIQVGLPLPYRCDQSEFRWRDPDFLQNLADQRLIEALASLYPPPDRIPMTRPYFLPGRPQAEQHFAIPANEQRPDGFCDWVLHGP